MIVLHVVIIVIAFRTKAISVSVSPVLRALAHTGLFRLKNGSGCYYQRYRHNCRRYYHVCIPATDDAL